MNRSINVLATAAVVALCLLSALGCKETQQVSPPSQTLSDDLKMAIDRETVREWNADNPPHRMTLQLQGNAVVEAVFQNVSDLPMLNQERAAKNDQSDADTAQNAEEQQEDEYCDEWSDYQDYSGSYSPAYSGDGFAQEGVREYDGRTETWYSSNQLYHKDTAQWSVDDEGYYRDSDGYYVVAASDMDQGAVFDGSKGKCKVYDDGCDNGVTDYYTAF